MPILIRKRNGFTLLEILIVTGIIAILAAVVLVAINPARQFAQARNTQRLAAINYLLNAIHQNIIDNQGTFDFSGCDASSIPGSSREITSASTADICGCLVPVYMASLPYDPSDGFYNDCDDYDTGYSIYEDADTERITIAAPSAELEKTIEVTR